MLRRAASIMALALGVSLTSTAPALAYIPPPFASLNHAVRNLARHVPGAIALDVLDLTTGDTAGYNAAKSMPAASTIKVPVMVEVFSQMEDGRFGLDRRVTLEAVDKDYGSGVLCDEPAGTTYPVSDLLEKMIDISDNTAANMLIRLVGRQNINHRMRELGLDRTHLAGDIRTDSWAIRRVLRTSPADMVHLLALMAKHELVDEWSSNEMIAILKADTINTLLPEPLPPDVAIAHKTGSLDDTLNDAGIVFASDSPYVIAVMTTALTSTDLGHAFIHSVSRLAYADEMRFARWREGVPSPDDETDGVTQAAPDATYWNAPAPGTASATQNTAPNAAPSYAQPADAQPQNAPPQQDAAPGPEVPPPTR